MFRINPSLSNHHATTIYNVLQEVNTWLKATGDEFVVDTKMFRMASHHGAQHR
jgi:hypothetical protein